MNQAYLGDALDHWKGSIIEFLVARGLVHDLFVDPMASDSAPWEDADFTLYASLLRIDQSLIVRHAHRLRDRDRYFAEIKHKGDVFLDPDIGLATGKVVRRDQYVEPRDVWRFLLNGLNRLVIVYQHVRAQSVSVRVDEVVGKVAGSNPLSWCSYESGTVALVFISLAQHRTDGIAEAFRRYLGRHANKRIRAGVVGHEA